MASSVVFGCISPPTVPNIPRPQSPIQKLFINCRRKGSSRPPSEEFHSSWISQKAAAAGGGSHSYWFSRSRSHSWISAISAIDDDGDDVVVFKQTPSMLPSRISPWLMLPPAFEEDGNMVYNFYSIKDDKVLSINKRDPSSGAESRDDEPADDSEFIGSSHGWLVLYDLYNTVLFLSNPISRRHIKLPPIHNIRCGADVETVILSSPPDEEDCRAIMIIGAMQGCPFCCCPGRSTQWTPISSPYNYTHSVYSSTQKLFFSKVNYNDYSFEVLDVGDPSSPKRFPMDVHIIDAKPDCDEENFPNPASSKAMETMLVKNYLCTRINFLVVAEAEPNSTADLLLVTRYILRAVYPDGSSGFNTVKLIDVLLDNYYDADGMRYPHQTIDFAVRKYDPDKKAFKYLDDSLDGLAIFIGTNHSFAMRASDFPELKPDSIYFTDVPELSPLHYRKWSIFGGHDNGIFNYKDKTISPCYYPCDRQSIKRIEPPPMWFTPSPL